MAFMYLASRGMKLCGGERPHSEKPGLFARLKTAAYAADLYGCEQSS